MSSNLHADLIFVFVYKFIKFRSFRSFGKLNFS